VDITPDWPVELSGYVARRQPGVGVRDPVFARALYLEGESGRLLWLHADVLAFECSFRLRLLERLDGFGPAEALLTASHTHSAPATLRLVNCGEPDSRYLALLEESLLEAASLAMKKPERTEMVAGWSRLDLARDRRGKPSAHVCPVVASLGWKREDGSLAAVVTNYGMHNVSLSHNNRLISADVAGETARLLSERLPGRPCVLTSNGACGNVNPPEVRDDDALLRQWGAALADAAEAALASASPAGGGIRAAFREVNAIATTPSPEEIREAAERHLTGLGGQTGYVADRIRDAVLRWRETCEAVLANPTHESLMPIGVHAIVLGGVPIAALSGEVFSVMTDRLTERVGRRVMVVGYANGDIGYLAPEAAYGEGGYEVDGACMFYGTLPIPRGAFERVETTAGEMLEALLT
jgi:hypothetical protein